MANRFRGFARMLSTAKNSTRKEGSGRMFSSTAQESPKGDYYSERMKEIYGADYAKLSYEELEKINTKRVIREFNNNLIEGLFIGLAIGSVYGYFAYGWYPFKETFEGRQISQNFAARDERRYRYRYEP